MESQHVNLSLIMHRHGLGGISGQGALASPRVGGRTPRTSRRSDYFCGQCESYVITAFCAASRVLTEYVEEARILAACGGSDLALH